MEKEHDNYFGKEGWTIIDKENSKNTTKNKKVKKEHSIKLDNNDDYEALAPIDIKTCDLVVSVAMRNDYQDTIMTSLFDIVNHDEDLPGFGDYPYFRINPIVKYVPKLDCISEILSERQLKELHMNIPYYQQYKNLKLLFSPSKHGTSMKQFYMNTCGYKTTFIFIKDDNQNVFGGYLSEPIRNSQKFYGTGESFVFTYRNNERIHCYHSSMENEYFIYSDDDIIAMGCDDKNFAFVIREDFLKGSSRFTNTFHNPTLAHSEEFFIEKMEVYAFDE